MTSKIFSRLLAMALGAWGWAAAAQTAPEGPGLRLNGFATMGVAHADGPSGWGFRRDAVQPSTTSDSRVDVDSRLGVQANYALSDRIEVVAQLLLKRRVPSSTTQESLEWAFVSYRPLPDLTLRFGRTGPDIFLLSDYRSVGFAYPWARPNVEFYGLLPVYSIDGADITQVWNQGDVRWRAKVFTGRSHLGVPLGTGSSDVVFTLDSLIGGMVSREEGGLLLRATLGRYRGGVRANANMRQADAALGAMQALPLQQIATEAAELREAVSTAPTSVVYAALGASYDGGDWLISGELKRSWSSLRYAAATAAYVSLGHRFGSVTAIGSAGMARWDYGTLPTPDWRAGLAPVVGPTAAAQLQLLGAGAAANYNMWRFDQRSLSLGLRWDFHPQRALKLQQDYFDVRANGSLLWTNAPQNAARHVNITSVVLDFVF